MTRRFGWVLVCPKCYDRPGHYYGILKVPSEAVNMNCPNCGTRLVDVDKHKERRLAIVKPTEMGHNQMEG